MTVGASLSIFCSEEMARADSDAVERMTLPRLLGRELISSLENACRVWPAAALPEIYTEQVGSMAPALLLSGELDPITPPRWENVRATVWK